MLSVDYIFNVRYLLVEGASITFGIIRSKIYHDHNINWWGVPAYLPKSLNQKFTTITISIGGGCQRNVWYH